MASILFFRLEIIFICQREISCNIFWSPLLFVKLFFQNGLRQNYFDKISIIKVINIVTERFYWSKAWIFVQKVNPIFIIPISFFLIQFWGVRYCQIFRNRKLRINCILWRWELLSSRLLWNIKIFTSDFWLL